MLDLMWNFACDINSQAVLSYQVNVDSRVTEKDIQEVVWQELVGADAWTFGFPCTNISAIGKKEGLFEGSQSSMFFQVMRLLDETPGYLRPAFLVAENVPELRKYLPVVQSEFEQRGYKFKYALYNSANWGVPQNRKRYFLVGYLGGLEFEMPKEQITDHPVLLRDILESDVDEIFFINKERSDKIISEGAKGILRPEKLGRTLRTSGRGSLSNRHNYEYILVDGRIRMLTPNEKGLMQGFPMDVWKHVASEDDFHVQMGNAVTVPVAEAVGLAIKETLSRLKEETYAATRRNT